MESELDAVTGEMRRKPSMRPVLIELLSTTAQGCISKAPDVNDLARLSQVAGAPVGWHPTTPMLGKGGRWGDLWRGYHVGLERIDDFYFRRGLIAASLHVGASGRKSSPIR